MISVRTSGSNQSPKAVSNVIEVRDLILTEPVPIEESRSRWCLGGRKKGQLPLAIRRGVTAQKVTMKKTGSNTKKLRSKWAASESFEVRLIHRDPSKRRVAAHHTVLVTDDVPSGVVAGAPVSPLRARQP